MPLSRSWMFIPGNQPGKLAKIDHTDADRVIVDLEDAVPLQEKEAARDLAAQWLIGQRAKPVYLRINDSSTSFFLEDLRAAAAGGAAGILLPKTSGGAGVKRACDLLSDMEKSAGRQAGRTRIVPLIESAAGLLAAQEIAQASGRIECLAFGSVDYTLDIHARLTKEGSELLFARSWLVNVSRAAGIAAPIDGVHLALKDEEGLRSESSFIKQLGFQGKLTIHPKQNPIVNSAFCPTEEEIKEAGQILMIFEEGLAQGNAAVQHNGKMIDYPVAEHARKILEFAKEANQGR